MANYICKASPFKATSCDGDCSRCSSARVDHYSHPDLRAEATIVPSYYLPFISQEDRMADRVHSI